MKKIFLLSVFVLSFSFSRGQIITTVAGNGTIIYSGDNGMAVNAGFNPKGVVVDSVKNIYITDFTNNRIRKVTYSTGIITTIAGNGVAGYSGNGGPAVDAELNEPWGITLDNQGNIYFTEGINCVVRKIDKATGIINTIVGTGSRGGCCDGIPAYWAALNSPQGLIIDSKNNLLIADAGNFKVRIVNLATDTINTFAGNGQNGYSGDGGPATSAELFSPGFICSDNTNVYIADASEQVVRKVDVAGMISTIAGINRYGFSGDGGPASAAELWNPEGIISDMSGNFFIADGENSRIRKIDHTTQIINTIAGDSAWGFSGDGGPPTSAELGFPTSIFCDNLGNIYVTDNDRIREIWSGPLTVTVNVTNPTNCLTCNGSSSGNVTGGYPPYTYFWSLGGGTNTFVSGLCTGMDTLTVTDSLGLSVKRIFVVGYIIADSVKSIMSDCANNSGNATVYPYNGTSPYTYLWSNGGTTSGISGLSGGTYTVFINDSLGCSQSINIVVPEGIAFTIKQTGNVSCTGMLNGAATIFSIFGGVSPYTYNWLPNGGTSLVATGLSAGSYTVNIKDVNGCTGSDSITITQPVPLSVVLIPYTNSDTVGMCYNDIEISPTVNGGIPPYSYLWSPSGSTYDTTLFLNEGLYSVKVTDANGCQDSSHAFLVPVFNPQIYNIQNVTCYGDSDGSVSYTFTVLKISEGWEPPGTDPMHLAAGTYTVYVDDYLNTGCESVAIVTITQPPPIIVITDSVGDNGSCNGIARVSVSGGTSPYVYSWAVGGTTDSINYQCAGNYCCDITDAHGCLDNVCVTINSLTGINQLTNSDGVWIVEPNPNNGIFTIVGTQNFVSEIEVYNVLGESVYKETLRGAQGDKVINLSEQPNGVYFYRIISENTKNIGEGKVVIQK